MLLWIDGFDHYGSGATGSGHMLEGPYAELGNAGTGTPETVKPRTGTYSYRMNGTGTHWFRRVFGGAKTSVGFGFALWLTTLPSSNDRWKWHFRDSANRVNVAICIQTTGAIAAYTGDPLDFTPSPVLLGTSTILVAAGAFNHIETKVVISNTVGSVEVRLNGVTVLNITGVDTVYSTNNVETSQVVIGQIDGNPGGNPCYIDDIFAWDITGTQNTDFLGDQKVFTLFPDSDTIEADWDPVSGTEGYPMIDETDPDDDATYISAPEPPTSAALISEFGFQDLAPEISSISAVYLVGRMRKTDAGTCFIVQSMMSGGLEVSGDPISITEVYTYWPNVFEINPNTGSPWSRSTLNAAHIRFTRSA